MVSYKVTLVAALLSALATSASATIICHECSGAACANRIPSESRLVECASEVTQCFTHLNAELLVSRGCGAGPKCDHSERSSPVKCQVCGSGDGCNGDPVALSAASDDSQGRAQAAAVDDAYCYTCNSTADNLCASTQNETSVANAQTQCATGTCYTYLDQANDIFYRGCLSAATDPTNVSQMCQDNPKFCVTCAEQLCNGKPKLRDPLRSCVVCNDSVECRWRQEINAAETMRCQKPVYFYYQNEYCYDLETAEGNVRRGCLIDEPEVCEANSCNVCGDYACNRKSYEEQWCIQCSSTEGGERGRNCDSKPEAIGGWRCQVDPLYQARGCYSYRDGECADSHPVGIYYR